MTSLSVIDEVAATYGVTKKDTKEFAKMFEEVIAKMLANGEAFKFADVNFSVKDVPAHTGRNPATGESLDSPASKKVVIKPSSGLKTVVK